MRFELCILSILAVVVLAVTPGCSVTDNQVPPNVLFIVVDDLRPEFGAYGKGHVQAPHLDRLAAEGTVFTRAYVNVPVCGASRASMLSGLRPSRNRFWDFDTRVDEDAPGVITLPEHFRSNGYTTVSLGKVFHHADDAVRSWTRPAWRPDEDPATMNTSWRDYQLEFNRTLDMSGVSRGAPYESAPVADSTYYDGKIAIRAVEELQRLHEAGGPFFLAVGFLKPHLPFNAPEKYWNLYDPASIRLAENSEMPEDAPPQAWHHWGELRSYAYVPRSPEQVADTLARKLIHGYYAAISYTDAQIGLVLRELDRLGLNENTIVVLVGDHGWSLGEHGLWCKHSPFHNAVHAPLIVRAPGYEGGQRVEAVTEFVDLYPSLSELAGLPVPEHLAGRSFISQLKDPSAPGKEAVFPRWRTSESIRTDRYLYTEWYDGNGETEARMLYDHTVDPEENRNVAESAAYANIADSLGVLLHEHLNETHTGL